MSPLTDISFGRNPALHRLAARGRMNSEVKRCSVNTKSEMVRDVGRALLLARTLALSTQSRLEPQSLAAREVVEDRCTDRVI